MKSQKKQVQSMLKDLFTIYEQLYGQKYTSGSNINQESEFNKIIEEFRELIFNIKHTQQERQKLEKKKGYHQSPAQIEINFIVREDIQRAENMLAEGVRRLDGEKKKVKKTSKSKKKDNESGLQVSNKEKLGLQLISKKQSILQNCFQLLQDIKQTEQGGVYHPPKNFKTLTQIKKQLIGKQYQTVEQDSINLQQEQFFDQVNKSDEFMDNQLDQIIEGNERIKNKMVMANQSMDKVHEKVIKATKKTEQLTERVRKDQKDLLDILKTYRRPNQLCLDITLVLMVLALIGVIINLIRTL